MSKNPKKVCRICGAKVKSMESLSNLSINDFATRPTRRSQDGLGGIRKEQLMSSKLREALSDACYAMFNFLKTQNGGYEEMAKALDKAKAALAEQRCKAKWKLGAEYEFAYCSHCGHQQWASWDSWREAVENIEEFCKEYKFCPNCGFKMKGATNEQ
jgi:rRNA maturation endonuclease Nob1